MIRPAPTSFDLLVDGVVHSRVPARKQVLRVTGLETGATHVVAMRGVNAFGPGAAKEIRARVPVLPGAPTRVRVRPGSRGGPLTLDVSWREPGSDGGMAVTGYRVTLTRRQPGGGVKKVVAFARWGTEIRTSHRGPFRVTVAARNAVGFGPATGTTGATTAR